MTDVSVGVRGKRKRGRPRKDSNLCREGSLQSPENASFMKSHQGADKNWKDCSEEGMVYGVVEGSFDAGYLISVRIGNNLAPFRGVVFQPRKVVAVTAANDVAPQAKMYQRREIQVPVGAPSISINFMAAAADPTGNLRMVEEDEVMQAFEVSTSSGAGTNGKESIINQEFQLQEMKKPPNLYYNENLFSAQSREAESSLKLDLAFTAHKDTVPNIGYHQALVAGNPLLLPPDLIGDPLELMMEKPKTPTNCNASLLGNAAAQPPYKLELATPHSPLTTRIADMDFLLTNANQ